jgi:hypothetical protein
VPRLVAVEGEVGEDGRYSTPLIQFHAPREVILVSSFPVYRHPADESPPLSAFSATVSLIREHVEKVCIDIHTLFRKLTPSIRLWHIQ